MKKTTFILTLLLLPLWLHAQDAYLFSYFKGEADGLHMAYSYDGLTWTPLKNDRSLLTPMVGDDRLMRDPSIVEGPDGTFHMVWTTSWNDRIIGYASSKDLINWSEQRAIPVMADEPKARNCWAPELFYDKASKTFYIFWATTIPDKFPYSGGMEKENNLNHRLYYTTTKDFKTFTKTQLMLDPGFSVIDAAIVKVPKKKKLIMVLKNETREPAEKNIRITTTKNIRKGFSPTVSAPITGDYWCEGPSPLYVGKALYVYFDKYTQGKYGAVRSLDNGKTWEDVSDLVSFPRGTRHGTAFKVSRALVDKLCNQLK